MTHRLALVLAVPILLVTGCTEHEPDDAEGSGSKTTSTGSTGPASEIEYPDEGVDLVDRPVMEGAYEKALQTYLNFERGRRLAAREGAVSRLLTFSATAPVVDPYREALAAYPDGRYDGDVVIEFLATKPRDLVLRVDICVDATQLIVPDGAPARLGEATRAPQRVDVTNIEGLWRVTKAEPVDGSC